MLLTGFHWKYFNWQQLEFYGQLNMLKAGIVFADQLTTVSPTYAQEIQAAPGGCGLEGVLAGRASDLTGIVNGIDVETWNPRTDELIPRHYSDADFKQGKYTARVALAARLGHAAPDDRPLVAFVGRLAEQKGVSLVLDLLLRMAGSGNARFVVLGLATQTGRITRLSHQVSGNIDVIGFDGTRASDSGSSRYFTQLVSMNPVVCAFMRFVMARSRCSGHWGSGRYGY